MKRLLPLLLVAAAALALGACNAGPDAAVVDGTVITQNALDADLAAIVSSPDQACFVQITEGLSDLAGTSLTGVPTGTYSTAFASSWLFRQVRSSLFEAFAAHRGFTLTPAELADARTDLGLVEQQAISEASAAQSQGGASSSCTTLSAQGTSSNITPTQLQSTFSKAFDDEVVRQEADLETALAAVAGTSDDTRAIAAYYKANSSDFENLCISAIGTDTQAHAAQFRAQALSGTSFAAIAAANPTDSGQLPTTCFDVLTDPTGFQNVQQLVTGVAVGGLSQPKQSGQDWLVLRVESAAPLPLGNVSSYIRDELLNSTANQTRFESAFRTFAQSAVVSVDPRDGTWAPTQGELFPPTSPPAKDLLSPAADQPSASSLGLSIPGASGGAGSSSSGSAG